LREREGRGEEEERGRKRKREVAIQFHKFAPEEAIYYGDLTAKRATKPIWIAFSGVYFATEL
jgi:hypothetical protein